MRTDSDLSLFSTAIRCRITYCPITGRLTWLPPDRDRFASLNAFTSWRTRFAGKTAGKLRSDGYISVRVTVDGVSDSFLAHRVAWFLYYGRWPSNFIDHINGFRTDNRIDNLREVSKQENQKNQKRRRTNVSGQTGVSKCKITGLWLARIYIDKVQTNLGRYADFDEAVRVRKSAEAEHGYHANHGRD